MALNRKEKGERQKDTEQEKDRKEPFVISPFKKTFFF